VLFRTSVRKSVFHIVVLFHCTKERLSYYNLSYICTKEHFLFHRNPGLFLFTIQTFEVHLRKFRAPLAETQGSFAEMQGFCDPITRCSISARYFFCIMWKYRGFCGNTGLICGNTGLICEPVTCPSTSARYCFLMRQFAKRRCKPIYAFFVWIFFLEVSYTYMYIHTHIYI